MHALFVVPVSPKKSVEGKFSKAAHGGRHLALKRLPAHLPVGDNFQADALLESDRRVDGAIFDCFEFNRGDSSSGELLLGQEQLRRSKQAADDVGVGSNHDLSPRSFRVTYGRPARRETRKFFSQRRRVQIVRQAADVVDHFFERDHVGVFHRHVEEVDLVRRRVTGLAWNFLGGLPNSTFLFSVPRHRGKIVETSYKPVKVEGLIFPQHVKNLR